VTESNLIIYARVLWFNSTVAYLRIACFREKAADLFYGDACDSLTGNPFRQLHGDRKMGGVILRLGRMSLTPEDVSPLCHIATKILPRIMVHVR